MLRDGPVPRVVHGAIEYVAAIAFIVVPLLLDYRSDAAVATSIVVGIVILVAAASTEGPTGLVNQIPIAAHVVLDYLLAIFLIAAPFLFGFAQESAPLIFFISLGVAHLLLTIATRFLPADARAERRGGRRSRRAAAADENWLEGESAPVASPADGNGPGAGDRPERRPRRHGRG